MRFTPARVTGVTIVDIEPVTDERGLFGRSWCADEFARNGLNPHLVQCNISRNVYRGTLRGMHLQRHPHEEAKLVRCTQGAIHDVALDLRRDSPTFCQWAACELTADNHRMLYIPEGCAHGFQTLTDEAEVFYQMSAAYHADSGSGVRYDDPAFGIEWPLPPVQVSARDAGYPDFKP